MNKQTEQELWRRDLTKALNEMKRLQQPNSNESPAEIPFAFEIHHRLISQVRGSGPYTTKDGRVFHETPSSQKTQSFETVREAYLYRLIAAASRNNEMRMEDTDLSLDSGEDVINELADKLGWEVYKYLSTVKSADPDATDEIDNSFLSYWNVFILIPQVESPFSAVCIAHVLDRYEDNLPVWETQLVEIENFKSFRRILSKLTEEGEYIERPFSPMERRMLAVQEEIEGGTT